VAEAEIEHQFVSGKVDGPDVTLVRPTNWNANHKLVGGAPGQAVIWDGDQATTKSGWGHFDHFNYVYNPSFETYHSGVGNPFFGWNLSGAGSTALIDAVNIRDGLVSAAVTRNGTDTFLYQDINLVWHNLIFFRGQQMSAGVWVRSSVGSVARISINDGIGASSSSFHTGNGDWEYLKVSRTLNALATVVRVSLEVLTGNATVQFDGVVMALGGTAELGEFVPSGITFPRQLVMVGSILDQTQGTTAYYGPWGFSATEGSVSFSFPWTVSAQRMRVVAGAAPAAGQTIVATLRGGETTDTALTVVLTDASRSGINITDIVPVAANEILSVKVALGATAGNRAIHIVFEIERLPDQF